MTKAEFRRQVIEFFPILLEVVLTQEKLPGCLDRIPAIADNAKADELELLSLVRYYSLMTELSPDEEIPLEVEEKFLQTKESFKLLHTFLPGV